MNATSLRDTIQVEPRSVALFAMNVDGETCTVRGTTVWPIAEVLDYEQQLDGLAAGTFVDGNATVDAALIVDVLDSRMIAPPRPHRRRQKAVSSRAVFYAGG